MEVSDYLRILVEAPPKRREAIEALVNDRHDKVMILEKLEKIIGKQALIVHRNLDKLKETDRPEYKKIIAAAAAEQAAIQAVLGILGPDGLLDDDRFVRLIDKTGMLERLGRWQEHVKCMREEATNAAKDFQSRHQGKTISKVKIFGLGGSGAPHDIVAEIINNSRKSSTEIEVVHADKPNADYVDKDTLAILCSFSGNTEETINCYDTIKGKTRLLVALAKGGKLREIARRDDIPFMQIPEKKTCPAYVMQPRESVCLQMTATLTFLASIGLRPGSNGSLTVADLESDHILALLQDWRERFGPGVPFRDNPAKRLAFFLLYGIDHKGEGWPKSLSLWDKKVPFVLADRNNWAIGHEPRTQMHERSKLNAAFYDAPEFLHNLVESIRASAESSVGGLDDDRWVYYFIRSPDEEPRIRLRLDKTIELVMQGKAKYAVLNAEGETPYQRALFATYFNAHMTTYLALLNGFDPLPVPTMTGIKNVMGKYARGGEDEKNARTVQREQLVQVFESEW